MLRTFMFAFPVLVLPLNHASAEAPPDLGANAALKYWQAFATLPRMTDAEGAKLNADCLTMPLDGHARELVTGADYSLSMLLDGAALPRCAWGIGHEEGIYVRLPQGPAARVLSALACLRARIRFDQGQNTEAIDDVVAAMTLGRHTSLEGGFIMVLVGYGIEHRAIDALALFVPKFSAKTLRDLKTRLESLPPFPSQSSILMNCEVKSLDWFVRKVKQSKDREDLLAVLSPLFLSEGDGKGGDPLDRTRAFVKECGGTTEGMMKRAEEIRPSYALLAKKLESPLDEFEKEFEREARKQAGNPVFKVLFPALVKCRRAQARTEVRRAMLSAAIAVQLDGREALKDHPDPVAGGAFDHVAFDGGFELRSRFKGTDDKPVVLTVGRRGN
jgi:hypothetical protein